MKAAAAEEHGKTCLEASKPSVPGRSKVALCGVLLFMGWISWYNYFSGDPFAAFMESMVSCPDPIPTADHTCPTGSYYESGACLPVPNDDPQWSLSAKCIDQSYVLKTTSELTGMNQMVSSGMAMGSVFVCGIIMDLFGRKPTLIMALVLNVIVKLLLFWACFMDWGAFATILFVQNAIMVMGMTPMYPAMNAMVADLTHGDEALRAKYYSALEVVNHVMDMLAFGCGFPVLALHLESYKLFWGGLAAVGTLALIFFSFVLRETRPRSQRKSDQGKARPPSSSETESDDIDVDNSLEVGDPQNVGNSLELGSSRNLGSSRELGGSSLDLESEGSASQHSGRSMGSKASGTRAAAQTAKKVAAECAGGFRAIWTNPFLLQYMFLYSLVCVGINSTWGLAQMYAQSHLHMSQEIASMSRAVWHGALTTGSLLAAPIVRRVGTSRALVIGMLTLAIGWGTTGLTTIFPFSDEISFWTFGVALGGIGFGILTPSNNTLVSEHVGVDVQGKVFSAQMILNTLIGVPLGILWPFVIFAPNSHGLRAGVMWLVSGGIFVVGALWLTLLASTMRSKTSEQPEKVIEEPWPTFSPSSRVESLSSMETWNDNISFHFEDASATVPSPATVP